MESFDAVVSTILKQIRAHQATGRRSPLPPSLSEVEYDPYRCPPSTWGSPEVGPPGNPNPVPPEVRGRRRSPRTGPSADAVRQPRKSQRRSRVGVRRVPSPRGLLST